MNEIEAFNQWLFLRMNAGVGTPSWAVNTAIVIADDLIYLIPVLLLVFWLWGDEARRSLAIKACLVAMLGVGMNQVIVYLIPVLLLVFWLWGDEARRSLAIKACLVAMLGVGMTQQPPAQAGGLCITD